MAICEQRLTIRLTVSKAAAKQAATTIRGLCTHDPLPTVEPCALQPLVSASSMADLLASPLAEHSSTVAPAVVHRSSKHRGLSSSFSKPVIETRKRLLPVLNLLQERS